MTTVKQADTLVFEVSRKFAKHARALGPEPVIILYGSAVRGDVEEFSDVAIWRHPMIQTHIIKEDSKPVAVILDYREYRRLKEIEQDKGDYYSALNTKRKNKKWTSHDELKKKLGM